MAYEYRTKRRVEFAETDLAGIVHFANFFRYMEETEHEFLRSIGISVHLHHEGRVVGWPRVSVTCEYHGPAYFEDELDVHLTVVKKGGKSLTYAFEFTRAGKRIAKGQMTTVCCVVNHAHKAGEVDKLEAIPIPKFIAEKIQVAPGH